MFPTYKLKNIKDSSYFHGFTQRGEHFQLLSLIKSELLLFFFKSELLLFFLKSLCPQILFSFLHTYFHASLFRSCLHSINQTNPKVKCSAKHSFLYP